MSVSSNPAIIFSQDFENCNTRNLGFLDGVAQGYRITARRAHSGRRSIMLTRHKSGFQDCHFVFAAKPDRYRLTAWTTWSRDLENTASDQLLALEFYDGTYFQEYIFGIKRNGINMHLGDDSGQQFIGSLPTYPKSYNTAAQGQEAKMTEIWHKITIDIDIPNKKFLDVSFDNIHFDTLGLGPKLTATSNAVSNIMRIEMHHVSSLSANSVPATDTTLAFYDDITVEVLS